MNKSLVLELMGRYMARGDERGTREMFNARIIDRQIWREEVEEGGGGVLVWFYGIAQT